ncbi:polysaccharide export protein [Catenovulum sp. 2E275]|uniref:polysaccharide biosynthesis/export family protein n=1 Tax=Catenovulum sp. 2E275 TaxID=2980497 RepID=UPI0021D08D3C|nr:polysaccharide biosynthesis/export family protein [Catenovulum sp. 2E275]MCU4676594.1 polysaccharide export protein [Catenovulum sp. 2E275]
MPTLIYLARLISLIFIMLCGNSLAQTNEQKITGYQLSAGDSISIHVFGQDDLTVTAKLDDKGLINYPFIGSVKITGKTTEQIQQEISSKLKQGYLVSPQVHVFVAEYRPFYVHGQVKRPGGFAYQPGLTVAMAIALAGGLTERASSSWFIKRATITAEFEVTELDLLYPGDILTVKQSFF